MAVRDGLLRQNPTDGLMAEIKKSHIWEDNPRHALTIPQQKAFMDYVKAHREYQGWVPIIAVLLGTGIDRTILSGIHAYYEPEELVGKTLIAITNLPPRKMMGIESCGMLLSAVNNLKDSEDEELHLIMVDNHIPAGAKLY